MIQLLFHCRNGSVIVDSKVELKGDATSEQMKAMNPESLAQTLKDFASKNTEYNLDTSSISVKSKFRILYMLSLITTPVSTNDHLIRKSIG